MAEDDMPGCSKCQQKHRLAAVPESGLPLIDQSCMSCTKLRKTFEEVPDKRPSFNRSVSCPVQGAIVSYLPEHGKLINDFLSGRESDDVSPEPSDTKISVIEESEALPRQPACRVKRQTIFNVFVCALLSVIICVIIYVALSGRSTGKGNHHFQPQAAVNSDLPRNATVAPHVHHLHCFSQTLLTLDISRLEQRDPDEPTNFVPFKIVTSSDHMVSLSADRRTVIFNEPGDYHMDVEFIMDTYSMDQDGLTDNRPHPQNLCLNIPGRTQVCRPLILGRFMRLAQRVNAEVSVNSGQNMSVIVHNLKMLFPDPHLNTLKITKRHC